MRVLHLLKTSEGASWAGRQMRELVKEGVEVHAIMPAGGSLIHAAETAGVRVHRAEVDFPIHKLWQWKSTKRDLIRIVDEVAPDLIHSHFVGTTLTMRLALVKRGPPRLFQVPGPLHLEHRLFRSAEIVSATDLDFWIGSCRWTCFRYEQSGVPRDRVGLSYYGTDVDGFQRQTLNGNLRLELGLSEHTPLVGMVAFIYAPKRYLGQIRGVKGHEDLIDAVAIAAKHFPDVVCAVVGGPWVGAEVYEQRLHRYARLRCGNRVVFLGTRDDVKNLYVDLDLAVHPSLSENVGGAVESLLLEVPTVATSVGGFPDLVFPGSTGWLVPPGNPNALAESIVEALQDPSTAHSLASQGRELARELFDVRRTAKEILKTYQSILGSGKIPKSLQLGVGGLPEAARSFSLGHL